MKQAKHVPRNAVLLRFETMLNRTCVIYTRPKQISCCLIRFMRLSRAERCSNGLACLRITCSVCNGQGLRAKKTPSESFKTLCRHTQQEEMNTLVIRNIHSRIFLHPSSARSNGYFFKPCLGGKIFHECAMDSVGELDSVPFDAMRPARRYKRH